MSIVSKSSKQVHQGAAEKEPPACSTGVKTTLEMVSQTAKAPLEAVPQGGLNEPKVRTGTRIDWLSVTLKNDWLGPPYPDGLTDVWVDAPGVHSYDIARRFADGRLELTHSSRQDMGMHIQFSGECLENALKTAKISDLELLRFYRARGATITRLDVALDAFNSGLELARLREAFKAGLCETKCKSGSIVQADGEGAGTTVYVGSRQSEAFARYYDKAAEQKVEGDWLRFELELKASKAEQAADGLLDSFAPDRYIAALICGHANFPTISQWSRIMSEQPTVITRAKKTESDTLSWLLDVCAPSLAKQIVMSNGQDVEQMFLERMHQELFKLMEQQLRQQQQ